MTFWKKNFDQILFLSQKRTNLWALVGNAKSERNLVFLWFSHTFETFKMVAEIS